MMNSMPAEQQTPDAPPGQDTNTLRAYLEDTNIALKLEEEVLNNISEQGGECFEYD